jgi:hypothetical protein
LIKNSNNILKKLFVDLLLLFAFPDFFSVKKNVADGKSNPESHH